MDSNAPVPVLVVEDDAHIRTVLCELLRGEGYAVSAAEDGLSALHLIRSSRQPLVILLDYWMPGINGAQVLAALAIDLACAQRHAYLVLTAARIDPAHLGGNLPDGLRVRVMAKPFDVDMLLTTIAEMAHEVT